MMSRLARPIRFLTLLLAAMQFALPAAVSVADGAIARAGRDSGTHVEEVGGKQCHAPHSADCLVCRFLTATHAETLAPVAAETHLRVGSVPSTAVALCGAATRHGFDSRAPPTILD